MEKKIKLLPPTMPNFINLEKPPGYNQGGVAGEWIISVKELTQEEACEYGEMMKQEFIKNWQRFQNQQTVKEKLRH